ncbi:hypothetical protein J3R75_001278 [Oligosphaera ethanolica]|uniref:Uncharacterized protein n=1 Tax=Oligosphaera ethanolica TaxID=760260 RepID=A0AAE3VEY7_9BACT|nr:hypothetical protein [Oligosphaera ethanolica]
MRMHVSWNRRANVAVRVRMLIAVIMRMAVDLRVTRRVRVVMRVHDTIAMVVVVCVDGIFTGGMRVVVVVLMGLAGGMRVIVVVLMGLAGGMRVVVLMLMGLAGGMRVVVVVPIGISAMFQDPQVSAHDAVAAFFPGECQLNAGQSAFLESGRDGCRIGAEINQCRQNHVAGSAREGFQTQYPHVHRPFCSD